MSSDPNEGLMEIFGDIPTIITVNGVRCLFYFHIDFLDYMKREGKVKAERILEALYGYG